MRLASLFVWILVVLFATPSTAAMVTECVGTHTASAPWQMGVTYDVNACAPTPSDGDVGDAYREAVETLDQQNLRVGTTVVGSWGVCVVAEPGTPGGVWTDIENDCDESPCGWLAAVFDHVGVGTCDADPCSWIGVDRSGVCVLAP